MGVGVARVRHAGAVRMSHAQWQQNETCVYNPPTVRNFRWCVLPKLDHTKINYDNISKALLSDIYTEAAVLRPSLTTGLYHGRGCTIRLMTVGTRERSQSVQRLPQPPH